MGKKISQKAWFCSYWTSILKWWKVIVSHKFTLVSEPCVKLICFFVFLSFFPVVSLPHSVFKGCAGASGSSPKHELRAGCHHLSSFSVHLCWGTIHQANRLGESTVAKLPIWNKSALNETGFSFPFFSASLLNQSLPSICMALEEVGFSAMIFCAEEAGSSSEDCQDLGLLKPWEKMSCHSVIPVLAGLGRYHQKFGVGRCSSTGTWKKWQFWFYLFLLTTSSKL